MYSIYLLFINSIAKFEVPTVVSLRSQVSWDIALFCWVHGSGVLKEHEGLLTQ